MDTVRVYRIEHGESGIGPHHSSQYISQAARAALQRDHERLPGMWKRGWFCGFTSLTKLCEYFHESHTLLSEHGFVFAEYEVPSSDVRRDGTSIKQCVFSKDRATLIRKAPAADIRRLSA